eukprot:SM003011S11755  [mRNA]  locus=s3011:72:504:- [translate_table: standard]
MPAGGCGTLTEAAAAGDQGSERRYEVVVVVTACLWEVEDAAEVAAAICACRQEAVACWRAPAAVIWDLESLAEVAAARAWEMAAAAICACQ